MNTIIADIIHIETLENTAIGIAFDCQRAIRDIPEFKIFKHYILNIGNIPATAVNNTPESEGNTYTSPVNRELEILRPLLYVPDFILNVSQGTRLNAVLISRVIRGWKSRQLYNRQPHSRFITTPIIAGPATIISNSERISIQPLYQVADHRVCNSCIGYVTTCGPDVFTQSYC